jgi:glycosyltransferase involved in cell wall biosynthesis
MVREGDSHMPLAAPAMLTASVVICTRNRPDTIEQAVASVLANTYAMFDVTVVDQSTTTATEQILRPLVQADRRLQYIHVEEPGLSRAYNTGIRSTQGQVIAFTDDDCVAPSDWLSTIVHAFSEDEEADLLYGQVLHPSDQTPGTIIPGLDIFAAERISPRDGFRLYGMGANCAARRRLFVAIGGFDEALGGGGPLCSSQDFDLAFRTYRASRATLLRPEVKVIHYGVRTPEEWPRTLRAYGIGDGAFYFKHVRCRDLLALRLLTRQILTHLARALAHRLRGHHPWEITYVRFLLIGIRESLRFDVDYRMRLYVSR